MVRSAGRSIRHLLFWAILAAQLVVPIIQLDEIRPARFGWQMFSGVGRPAEFEIELVDGTVQPVEVDEVLARLRPEMDLATTLPPLLCRRVAAADHVRTRVLVHPKREVEIPCP